jgi:hypothetical protein
MTETQVVNALRNPEAKARRYVVGLWDVNNMEAAFSALELSREDFITEWASRCVAADSRFTEIQVKHLMRLRFQAFDSAPPLR